MEGCKGVVPNGNFIFFPAAGYMYYSSLYSAGLDGCYWSSSLHASDPTCAYFMSIGDLVGWSFGFRDRGRSVRPVQVGFIRYA